MCVGVPAKVISIKGQKAQTKTADHCHWVDISSLDEELKIGDYLIAYQNAAVNKVSAKDAQEIIALMDSAGDTGVKSAD